MNRLTRTIAAVGLSMLLAAPWAAASAATPASAGDCLAATKRYEKALNRAQKIHRVEVRAAKKHFKRSDRKRADRKEFKAAKRDSHQALRANKKRAVKQRRRAC